ncbi:histidine phosphatase family protein [Streptomyces sp. LN785]|uniref:histidine phosphatase family protein n=1 Tax=Streptomyces sp. LN785 TaxID=3112983 RepID=UPI00371CC915
MTVFHLVQHAEKEQQPGDPGLTAAGRREAARTAEWLRQSGARAVFSSPSRRARESAQFIATGTGPRVREDSRLRERMNWDGSQRFAGFLTEWTRSVKDRDFV